MYSEQPAPARPPEGSTLLGYDVADAGWISGLANCEYTKEEIKDLGPVWADRLNPFGLSTALEDAVAFRKLADRQVPEHLPFGSTHCGAVELQQGSSLLVDRHGDIDSRSRLAPDRVHDAANDSVVDAERVENVAMSCTARSSGVMATDDEGRGACGRTPVAGRVDRAGACSRRKELIQGADRGPRRPEASTEAVSQTCRSFSCAREHRARLRAGGATARCRRSSQRKRKRATRLERAGEAAAESVQGESEGRSPSDTAADQQRELHPAARRRHGCSRPAGQLFW